MLVPTAFELLCLFYVLLLILESGLFTTLSDAHTIVTRNVSILWYGWRKALISRTCRMCMSSYQSIQSHAAKQ